MYSRLCEEECYMTGMILNARTSNVRPAPKVINAVGFNGHYVDPQSIVIIAKSAASAFLIIATIGYPLLMFF